MNKQLKSKRRNLLVSLSVTATLIALSSARAQPAGTECYDFDKPPVGTEYELGDSVVTENAQINLQTFRAGDLPSQATNTVARVTNSNLLDPPSLQLTSVVVQVVPASGAQRVTFDYAENTGLHNTQRQNFGVNGQRLNDLVGGLAQLDGEVLGLGLFGGQALVQVTAVPDSVELPTWVRGQVTVTPLNGSIRYFAFGSASSLHVDHVCMTW